MSPDLRQIEPEFRPHCLLQSLFALNASPFVIKSRGRANTHEPAFSRGVAAPFSGLSGKIKRLRIRYLLILLCHGQEQFGAGAGNRAFLEGLEERSSGYSVRFAPLLSHEGEGHIWQEEEHIDSSPRTSAVQESRQRPEVRGRARSHDRLAR